MDDIDGIRSTAPRGTGRSLWDLLKDILDRQAAVVAIAGLALYVMVRFAYDALYADLELTPEEVGLTYPAIVARAALGLITYTILILAGFFVLALFRALLSGTYPRSMRDLLQQDERMRSITYVFVILGAVGAVAVYFSWTILQSYFSRLSYLERWLYSSLLFAITLVTVRNLYVILRTAVSSRVEGQGADAISGRLAVLSQLLTRGGLLLVALAVIASFLLLPRLSERWGHYKAQLARGGQSLQPSPLYGILDIRIRKVCLTWIGSGPPPLDTTRPFMYLGRAQDTVALYDYFYAEQRQQRQRRIPASNILLRGLGDDRTCNNDPASGGGTPPSTGAGMSNGSTTSLTTVTSTSNSSSTSTSASSSASATTTSCICTTMSTSCPCTPSTAGGAGGSGTSSIEKRGRIPGEATGFDYSVWIVFTAVLLILGVAALQAGKR